MPAGEAERLGQADEEERLGGAVRADEEERRLGGECREDDGLEVIPADDGEGTEEGARHESPFGGDIPSHSRMAPASGEAGRHCHRAPPLVEAGRRSGGRVTKPGLSPPLCMLATETEVAGGLRGLRGHQAGAGV